MEICPLGTPWCTDHEPPDAPDNWAECVSIIGTVVLDHGPTTAAFRSDPDEGTSGEVIISVRQIEGDSPIVEVEWPDSTAEFPGVENWTSREAREIGGYMVQGRGSAGRRPVDEHSAAWNESSPSRAGRAAVDACCRCPGFSQRSVGDELRDATFGDAENGRGVSDG